MVPPLRFFSIQVKISFGPPFEIFSRGGYTLPTPPLGEPCLLIIFFWIPYSSVLTILTILVILSTSLEILKNQNKLQILEKFSLQTKGYNELLLSFSLIRNTRSLFTTNKRFEALDTIRLFLIINVHIAHIYGFTASIGLVTLKKTITEITPKILNDNRYVFARNSIIVDALFTIRFESIKFSKIEKNFIDFWIFKTCKHFHKLIQFFFSSGFIMSYGLLRKLDETRGGFNYLRFLFYRWIKFSVPLLGSILFFYLFPLFGDGPVWNFGLKWVTPGCENATVLLRKFLFIDNFDGIDEQTLTVSKLSIH